MFFLADRMEYLSVKEWAQSHGVSERTARNYCAQGKIPGAQLIGKTWSIPAETPLPSRRKTTSESPLLARLKEEKEMKYKGGIYHCIQIDLTYNSNHIEGSRLTHDQTRNIFETNTIGITDSVIKIDDIIETTNHFRAIDYIITESNSKLTEAYICHLHKILKSGTSDEKKEWFNVGAYKQLPNEVGGRDTTPPEKVHSEMKKLLKHYNSLKKPKFEDVIDFHYRFETIHPFQDGNGRVGRLIMFRECLRLGFIPFIITEDLKMFYYNGLRNWPYVKSNLLDTCLAAQDNFKIILKALRITRATKN